MTNVKWIKIVIDIFDDEKIKLIEALPSADTIIVIWFKILCLAGKINNGGVLTMNDRIAYTDEMLATIFRRKITDVRMALEVFVQYGMIEIIDNAYVIPNWSVHQSLDTIESRREKDRIRQRKHREEQKALEDKSNSGEEDEMSRDSNVTSRDGSYSYSFISNSNTKNMDYLITNNLYKDCKYIQDNLVLYDSIRDWMEYKDERTPKKNNHYGERALKSLLTEIVNHDKRYGTEAVAKTIRHTIANQWQGIVWDWLEKKFKPLEKKQEVVTEHRNMDRPERFRNLSESTWNKIKGYVSDDGGLDWTVFDVVLFTYAEKKELKENGIGNWTV